ncbi:MAG: flagellin [Oscillospiraceae bacterium]|nr:flagellin [Oscillospiraceae bacterium]
MRINNNIGALNAQSNVNKNNNAVANRLEKLSSGKRINKAADDAAGLAISEKMRTSILGTMAASRNTQDAVSLIQVAEGGLSSMQGMLQRARELALQSANGPNDDAVDRNAIQGEFASIVNELDDTTSTTQFNGMNILDGTADPVTIQAGPNAGDTVDIKIDGMTAQSLLGLSGSEYNAETDANLASSAAASSSLDTIDNAINDISTQRAELGAMQNRLEFRMQALDIQAENATAANSRIRDTDMAKMMSELTAKNILQKASTAMLAQANARPQNIVGMLG